MKRILRLAAFFLAALAAGAFLSLPPLEERYAGVYDKTLRLHILAASDSEEDQALKLALRDELLSYLAPLLERASDRGEAEIILKDALGQIEERAEAFLAFRGRGDEVKVCLGREFYPARTYENCSFPAGEYLSLRVLIGGGKGKNWWCVLYPPLCLSSSEAFEEGYTGDEQALLKRENGGYKVRFFLLDLLAKIKKRFS